MNDDIVNQPAFYLLIAATVLLTLGFTWGRRRNARILHRALDAVSEVLKPRDQQYTNIGGETGYHANFIPSACRTVRRVDATVTLLPRQSWLYLPFSYIIQRFDRLYLTFFFNRKARGRIEEGHLIERRFEKMRGNRIENADRLEREAIEWEGVGFHLYYANDTVRETFLKLKEMLGSPRNFRHAALVPAENSAYLFQIPQAETVAPIVAAFRDWLDHVVVTTSPTSKSDAS